MDEELNYIKYHDLLYDIHSYFYALFDCFRKLMGKWFLGASHVGNSS
jgi:hypothetical protein